MPPADFEQTLRDLPSIGRLVKERPFRQVWRFEHEGKAYYLKFYPREDGPNPWPRIRSWFRRLRGSPAMLEFLRLQMLQRAGVPAPRAVSVLMGFHMNGRRGDAVIMEAIEPSVTLDHYLSDFLLRGKPVPDHRAIAAEIRNLVKQMTVAKLGHDDLHLGNFLLKEGKVYLLDGYAVRRGMRAQDIYRLAHSVAPFATVTDLMRGWNVLAGGGLMPRQNPISPSLRQDFLKRIGGGNRYFGRLHLGEWSGVFFRSTKFAKRWSAASTLQIEASDWEKIWPELWKQIENDELRILKRSRSGDVFATELVLGGKPLQVVIKRPFKRYWYRYVNEVFRRSRSWRGWAKGWHLIARNLPTAWPLLVMERRHLGYITDHISIFERVPGTTLGRVNLDALPPRQRDMLFRRVGRILRIIDQTGLSHFDAKAPNWLIRDDPELGPTPVLIDTDAVRFRRWIALGIERLLRSMKEHPQYTPEDSLSLCLGYAPYSPVRREEQEVGLVK